MDFKKLIYGGAYYRCKMYDIALECFKNSDHMSYDRLYKNAPDNVISVYEFLQSEGMCRLDRYGVSITERGKTRLLKGGYVRMLLFERLTRLSVIIAIISGLGGILTYLFCKLHPFT